ncbi:hypothetical protein [Lachnotalea glycerini]|nr:hypothetical protein [Lachnotalea glycerini]
MDKKEFCEIELVEAEVNVYASGCGDPKTACLVDCIDHTAWLSTAQ